MIPTGRLMMLAALLLPAAARAEPLRDVASGLQVEPPPGYAAQAVPPGRGQTARFSVKTPTDTDKGCQVSFMPAPGNARFSQAEINRLMSRPAWQEDARKALSDRFEVTETLPFRAGSREGLMMLSRFRERPDLSAREREARMLMVVEETPRGRTTTICAGDREGFGTRRAEFVAVANGVTPP